MVIIRRRRSQQWQLHVAGSSLLVVSLLSEVAEVVREKMPVLSKLEAQLSLHKRGATKEPQGSAKEATEKCHSSWTKLTNHKKQLHVKETETMY